jgi:hypothetical protein
LRFRSIQDFVKKGGIQLTDHRERRRAP